MIFWKICCPKDSDTLRYAADELARCLEEMDSRLHIALLEGDAGSFRLRVDPGAFAVADPRLDDAYRIDFRDGAGEIVGSNERSVLFGVYRLLHELGCTWVRPGRDG